MSSSINRDLAWGRYYDYPHRRQPMYWRHEQLSLVDDQSLLPHGMGRSYGDSCLNENNTLIETRTLNRLISFNQQTGIICCEAGVTLETVVHLVLPHGWFLPVTPGTKHVTLGGAIANDVHGKNHHHRGTFGCHVKSFELLRSDGQLMQCSTTENTEFYGATIGGLGLTGLITQITLQLMPVNNPFLCVEEIRYESFDEFLILNEASKYWQYTVAWVDSLSESGRGLFIRANHAPNQLLEEMPCLPSGKKMSVPFSFSNFVLNKASIGLFNQLYWRKNFKAKKTYLGHYEAFFYPLDALLHWNRIYGKRGFLQYQFVVPVNDNYKAIRQILKAIAESGCGSFLTVLKAFGEKVSPGLLSFPCPGVTFALDFPNRGQATLDLLENFDKLVLAFGGRVYPAKDARMSGDAFKRFYPNYKRFKEYIDPSFSSSFWRRIMEGEI